MLDQTLVNEIGSRKSFNVKKASARLLIWSDGLARVSAVLSRNPGHGEATEVMLKVIQYADEHDLDLELFVQRYGDPHTGLSNPQLITFYSKFGFVLDQDGKKPVRMYRSSQKKHVV